MLMHVASGHLICEFTEWMYHELFTVGPHPSWSLNLQICLFSKFTYPQINAYSIFVVIHGSQSGEKFKSPDEQFPYWSQARLLQV